MEHPASLQSAVKSCEAETSERCTIIMRAATDMQALMIQFQSDPEQFGEHILDAEERQVQLQLAMQQAQEEFERNKNNDTQVKFDAAKKAYAEQAQEIKIALAMIGLLSTPK